MGFSLWSMSVDARAANDFRVCIAFEPRGALCATTLAERISSCVGGYDVMHDSGAASSASSAADP
jgi:hypothetical protein